MSNIYNGAFCKYTYHLKTLDYFHKKVPSQITDWALNTPLEYQKLHYTNVQEKVTPTQKWKECENWSGQTVQTAILICSPKKTVLRFLGKHAWQRPMLPVSLQPGTFLKKNFKYIFLWPIWNYSQILFYLRDNCNQNPRKLPLLVGSFFQLQNTLNLNHGLS